MNEAADILRKARALVEGRDWLPNWFAQTKAEALAHFDRAIVIAEQRHG